MCQTAFTVKPSKATNAKYPHKLDWTASALSAALPVTADRHRFSWASRGMTIIAATNTAIPKKLDLGTR